MSGVKVLRQMLGSVALPKNFYLWRELADFEHFPRGIARKPPKSLAEL
jgi:hypothetical protein